MRTYTLHLAPEAKLNVVEAAGVKPACETCRYFVTKPLRPGSCRRYPPTPFGYTEELGGKNICDFPTVLAEDWCGEYEAKAKVK